MFLAGEIFRIKQMPILMVIGSWSMAAFILTIYYNTLLISFISAPNPKPLINSIYDLQNRSDLFLLTDEVGNTNAIISVIYILIKVEQSVTKTQLNYS